VTGVLAVAAGWAIAAGWLYVRWDYFQLVADRYVLAVPSPPVTGVLSHIVRLGAALWHAAVVWLPGVLWWPYWIALAAGVWRLHRSGAEGRRLNQLFLSILLPVLAFVALTEPHARTGAILLAPAMIWMSVAGDGVLGRASRLWNAAAYAAVALVCGIGLAGAASDVRSTLRIRDLIRAEAMVLRAQSAPRGRIWAFGDERSLYGIFGWPERSDYARRMTVEVPILGDRSAGEFLAALRDNGYRYLMFDLPPGASERVPQPDWPGPPPRRSMLEELVAGQERFRLKSLGASDPLWVFEILP
jgi:hypothetical protein